jgi:hypothetical protein
MTNWKKLGRIFKPECNYSWMNSHITPLSSILLEDRIRVFICSRSEKDPTGNYLSNTSFIDLDINDPRKIIYLHDKPIIDLGSYGTFDEFGIMVTNVVLFKNKVYLYYAGWQRLGGNTAAYQVMLGLAISIDFGYNFKKVSQGPIMGIDIYDPISIGNVSVIKDVENWKMYYTSLTEWKIDGIKPTYEYIIKYAQSNDGIHWNKTNKVILEMKESFGVATPSVIKYNNKYHMWFGYRKAYANNNIGGYNIGYACSIDGLNWNRNDELYKLIPSEIGWDSEMVCYPEILKVNDKIYMLYCGNGFGYEGFGIAVLDCELT